MTADSSPISPPPIEIVEFNPTDEIRLAQAASILYDAMEPVTDAWPTVEAALGEILDLAKIKGGVVFLALDEEGEVCGLVAGQPRYTGHVMELHPIAVRPRSQRCGIGRALVAALEDAARKLAYTTILLGSEDETGQTSLAGKNLYPDPLEKLSAMEVKPASPVGFYRRLGYCVVGVVPDANGAGRPDIWMAKKI